MALFFAVNIQGRLDVKFFFSGIHDKINLILRLLPFAINNFSQLNHTDIDAITSTHEFNKNEILHQMRAFLLPEIKSGIAQPQIHGIVFLGVFEIFLPLYIISFGPHKKIGIFQLIDVIFDGVVGSVTVHKRACSIGKIMRIGERTHR